jgi:hypothetical protein
MGPALRRAAWRSTMRVIVLLMVIGSALAVAAVTTAGAATKHWHRVHRTAVVAKPVPAWPNAIGRRPHECVTDEGGGRFMPCNYGGGMQ